MFPPLLNPTSCDESDGVTKLAIGVGLVSQVAAFGLVILDLNLGLRLCRVVVEVIHVCLLG